MNVSKYRKVAENIQSYAVFRRGEASSFSEGKRRVSIMCAPIQSIIKAKADTFSVSTISYVQSVMTDH